MEFAAAPTAVNRTRDQFLELTKYRQMLSVSHIRACIVIISDKISSTHSYSVTTLVFIEFNDILSTNIELRYMY